MLFFSYEEENNFLNENGKNKQEFRKEGFIFFCENEKFLIKKKKDQRSNSFDLKKK